MDAPTLYERAGGERVVAAAVEVLYQRILDDPLLRPFFVNVSIIGTLKDHQRSFLMHVLGGPAPTSGGPDLRKAHSCFAIEQRHFDAVSDHLADAFYSLGLDEELIAEVISLLAPLAREIVNAPTSETIGDLCDFS